MLESTTRPTHAGPVTADATHVNRVGKGPTADPRNRWLPPRSSLASIVIRSRGREPGFARVRCGECGAEFLVAFSCKCRYFCPSCHAKRLRPYFLYDRRLLGLLSRVAYDTLRDFMRATDGAFRPDGTFVPLGAHSLVVLTEAFRRATLGAFVQRGLLSPDVAASMLAWPHSGFHVHNAVRLAGEDLRGTLQLARYAEEGSGGPAPDPDAEPAHHDHAPLAEPPSPSPAALRKRWAELLRRTYEVDPLSCPRCGGELRIIAFILDPPVIDAILRHLRRASVDARAGPWAEVAGRNAVAGDAGPGGWG